MKHLFVSCALAIALKEKGFDEDCLAYYTNRYAGKNEHPTPIHQHEGSGIGADKNSDFTCKYFIATAPLYQQVIDWFREEQKIDILPNITYDNNGNWYYYRIHQFGIFKKHSEGDFDYYIAINKAIEEALKLI